MWEGGGMPHRGRNYANMLWKRVRTEWGGAGCSWSGSCEETSLDYLLFVFFSISQLPISCSSSFKRIDSDAKVRGMRWLRTPLRNHLGAYCDAILSGFFVRVWLILHWMTQAEWLLTLGQMLKINESIFSTQSMIFDCVYFNLDFMSIWMGKLP